jgi:multidrug resistance protein
VIHIQAIFFLHGLLLLLSLSCPLSPISIFKVSDALFSSIFNFFLSFIMADPEIGLADQKFGSSLLDLNGQKKDVSLERDVETSSQDSDIILDESSPIVYHYLTFETTLPLPLAKTNAEGAPLPEQPNLKKYMSPFEWPEGKKTFIILLSCIATMITAYTPGSYTPGIAQMSAYWNVSEVALLVGTTTFCSGFAFAPMVLAPFSEINGRYPVFVGAGVLFVIGQICCAVTRSYPGMLLARFATGVGSSVFSTMVGGVVSDLYHAKDRNTPMALFSGFALGGTGLGPLVSGFIAYHMTWRWIFWVQVITCGTLIIFFTCFFDETRGSILLSRKAAHLNKWYAELESLGHYGLAAPSEAGSSKIQRIRWRVKSDEDRESITKMIGISVVRPFHLLFTEPVVFFFSLWVAFAWAVLYLTFGAITLVFSKIHNFNIEQSGAVFAAMSIGAIIATILSIVQEKVFTAAAKKGKSQSKLVAKYRKLSSAPEGRLFFACVECTLLPIGLFWFGWTQKSSIPWIVPTISVGCATMGIYSVYLACFNYFADTYHRYASSALAAQSFCRNMLGGIFPLVTAALFNNLGFGAASSLLGGIVSPFHPDTIIIWLTMQRVPYYRLCLGFSSSMAPRSVRAPSSPV